MGQIIEAYDYNKQYPVYGFGGIMPGAEEREVSHCFPLSGVEGGMVNGVMGILETY